MDQKVTTRKLRKGNTVWLITWEWCGDHAKVEDKFVAIFNPHWGPRRVKDYVEVLYSTLKYTVGDKLGVAIKPRCNPYRAEYGFTGQVRCMDRIRCGHNPWLYARLVDHFQVQQTEDGEDVVSYDERKIRKEPPELFSTTVSSLATAS